MNDNILAYQKKKEKLQSDLNQASKASSQSLSLYKTTSNLFRPDRSRKQDTRIDVRQFNQVLHVDNVNLTATVEGMTTYEALVNETLKHSLLPTVVPELKTITIGGALSGVGIESSSFRFGLVHETIKETEILLNDGRIITCSPTNEHKDLFFAFPNSYGTLGYALKVVVQLIPVKPFVKLTHHRFSDPSLFFEAIEKMCIQNRKSGQCQFIDGVIFSLQELYITTGEFVDTAPYTSDYRYLNIFYRSIQAKHEDYLTTHDYIWRWDTDWFWCSKVFYMQNPIMRTLFGKWMLSSKVYTRIMNYVNRRPFLNGFLKSMQSRKESVIQDVLIPINKANDFLKFFQKEIGISPIWICPYQAYSPTYRYDFCPIDPNQLYLDFGFWDAVNSDQENGFYNRKIEKKVTELNGFKSLYSSSYYTEEEFWHLYNHSKYLNLKSKYDPQNRLNNLYNKCTRRMGSGL